MPIVTKDNNNAQPPLLNPLCMIQHTLPGHQPPCPHQRARCLKFSPSLSPIQINNRRNAEEGHCVGVESLLIELPQEIGETEKKGRAISRFTNKIDKAFEC